MALRQMALISLERLEAISSDRYPSHALVDYYDIIHKLLEAISLCDGKKFRGDGAHKQLIDYVYRSHQNESVRIFIQEMREYRNRISYEGFMVLPEYILANKQFIMQVIKSLDDILESLLSSQSL